jgi:diguanylate cyclase (GGDEF)-like protein
MNTENLWGLLAAAAVIAGTLAFLFHHIRKNAVMARLLREEKQRSEVVAEVTRSLSVFNSREVLYLIADRIAGAFEGSECLIVQLGEGGAGKILVKSGNRNLRDSPIDLQAYPEIREVNESRKLLFAPRAERGGVSRSLAVFPMLAQSSVVGIIYVEFKVPKTSLRQADERFFETMASAGANALRNAQLFDEMEHKTRSDYLTGLVNHRSFQAMLSAELARARRHGHQLSLLIADIDHLKAVNDKLGHVIGDSVIREVAETIRMSCRNADMAARYGGEEFGVILPEAPLVEALQVAERIRERVNESIYTGAGHVTISIGVASYPTDALGKDDLVRAAERAVLISKNGGRNRVSYFDAGLNAGKRPV